MGHLFKTRHLFSTPILDLDYFALSDLPLSFWLLNKITITKFENNSCRDDGTTSHRQKFLTNNLTYCQKHFNFIGRMEQLLKTRHLVPTLILDLDYFALPDLPLSLWLLNEITITKFENNSWRDDGTTIHRQKPHLYRQNGAPSEMYAKN